MQRRHLTIASLLALALSITIAAAQQASPVSSANTAATTIDMSKQPADVKAAQELLEARALAWQRLVQSIMAQPTIQAEQKALAQAEADRDAKILKAAGKDATQWIVEATPAGLRIVEKPKENQK